jgi:hypothetical protein
LSVKLTAERETIIEISGMARSPTLARKTLCYNVVLLSSELLTNVKEIKNVEFSMEICAEFTEWKKIHGDLK